MPGLRGDGPRPPACRDPTSAVPPEVTVQSSLSPTVRRLRSGLHGAKGRYLLRSSEAALRQSSRKQNSGYWRQISRPTSSRSRCFSLHPIVRIQDPISVQEALDVPPSEAEAEGTPTARRRSHITTHYPASQLNAASPGTAPRHLPRVRNHRPLKRKEAPGPSPPPSGRTWECSHFEARAATFLIRKLREPRMPRLAELWQSRGRLPRHS